MTVKKTQVFHDRFITLDGKTAYHIVVSIKNVGRKCFGISLFRKSWHSGRSSESAEDGIEEW